jgi:hypothetical protein
MPYVSRAAEGGKFEVINTETEEVRAGPFDDEKAAKEKADLLNEVEKDGSWNG